MDDLKQALEAIEAAVTALVEARGPTNPKAVYRVGSRPNQAEVMQDVRDFLSVYAAAGNTLMRGEHPGEHIERLQNLGTKITRGLDELIESVVELS